MILSAGRAPKQRSTPYGVPPQQQIAASFGAVPLTEMINAPPRKSKSGNDSGPSQTKFIVGE